MALQIIKLPDVGEGVAEAEIVELKVKLGDMIREDDVVAAVMTDKASVEIPSPVSGIVTWIGGEVGETLAVGSALMKIETAENTHQVATKTAPPAIAKSADTLPSAPFAATAPVERWASKPLASPSLRMRAREAGIDLANVPGSGPGGRIRDQDLAAYIAAKRSGSPAHPSKEERQTRNVAVEEIKIMGLRRTIATRMQEAKRHIPHITYVEEVDVTALEELRAALNAQSRRPKVTLLAFLMQALVRQVKHFPQMNARFDDQASLLRRYGGVHIGIATQTPDGLMVPVVRHAEARGFWDCAAEMKRVTQAAREGSAKREELVDSTITVSSLGALGGIVSTPIINAPEVAIIGVNKIAIRPVWIEGAFVPRKIMNLSSAFDHRVIDGHDAASFIQAIRKDLETPAMLFMET